MKARMPSCTMPPLGMQMVANFCTSFARRQRRRPRHCIVQVAARGGRRRAISGSALEEGRRRERGAKPSPSSFSTHPSSSFNLRISTVTTPAGAKSADVRIHLVNNTIRLVGLLLVLSPLRPAQQIQSTAVTKP